MTEVFLLEASEHLQFLREYSSILQDPYPAHEDLERLYVAAHTLGGVGRSLWISGSLRNRGQAGAYFPVRDERRHQRGSRWSTARVHLRSHRNPRVRSADDQRQLALKPQTRSPRSSRNIHLRSRRSARRNRSQLPKNRSGAQADIADAGSTITAPSRLRTRSIFPTWNPTAKSRPKCWSSSFPEAEEHLQIVTECLLALEANPNAEDIHRLFRAMHTIKGSAAQVGLHRISRVAHRAEDLIGRLREGATTAQRFDRRYLPGICRRTEEVSLLAVGRRCRPCSRSVKSLLDAHRQARARRAGRSPQRTSRSSTSAPEPASSNGCPLPSRRSRVEQVPGVSGDSPNLATTCSRAEVAAAQPEPEIIEADNEPSSAQEITVRHAAIEVRSHFPGTP